ncbi:MAG: gluconokinase [Pseudomonadota bacterium]
MPANRNIVVMGVAGSGKSVIGSWLAEQLGRPFHDGDDFHPPGNVEKMSRGEPLDDHDRAGWLARLVDLLTAARDNEAPIVVACSALKDKYRQQLSADDPPLFLFLDISQTLAEERLKARSDHFMPSSLVQSQFDTLERPTQALSVRNDREITVVQEEVLTRVTEALQRS